MTGAADIRATGGCLCGAVRFAVRGPLSPAVACHCGQCRKQTGHFMVATRADREALSFERQDGLAWYRASDAAERGFCKTCGSTLFWSPDDAGYVAIAMGALDPPTGLKIARHIFAGDKSDYYDIGTDVPVFDGDD